MTIAVSDYIDLRRRLQDLGCTYPIGIAILPENLETATTVADLRQRSEAATVKTLFRQHHLPLSDLVPAAQRPPYIQNNAFEWIAPVIFISGSLLAENPDGISVALGVLSNYLTDFFKGISRDKKVKLTVVVEKKADATFRKITYEGDIKGIEILKSTIKDAAK